MSEAPPDWLAQPLVKPAPPPPQADPPVGSSPPPAPPAGWTPVGPNQVTGPHQMSRPQAAMLDTVQARAYAEWLVWARRQFPELARAHAAARAAFSAALAGADASNAMSVGTQAAAHPETAPPAQDPRLESFASWFAWAQLDMRARESVCEKVASAAASEQARGARPEAVAQAAQQVLSSARVEAQRQLPPLLSDPAMRGVATGVFCLALNVLMVLFAGHAGFVLRFTPALGIFYSLRTLGTTQRTWLALLGLGLNGVAILLALVFFFV